MAWPESVVWLRPSDTCAGEYQDDKGRVCLDGAINLSLNGRAAPSMAYSKERRVFRRTLCDVIGLPEIADIAWWNDTHTPKERAAAWQEACRRLGYVEVFNEDW